MTARFNSISLAPIIPLEDWSIADEPLTGSRDKSTVIDPETEKYFVFKEPKEFREAQIWSELLASFIAGDLLSWPVQHVSLALRDGKIGSLMEYIYRDGEETFTEGWTYCREVDPNYDIERGERHTLPLLYLIADRLESDGLARQDYFAFWGQAFALDALISNSDRHAENWAVIKGQDGLRMAPLYDNATSMACEWDEQGLERKWFDPNGRMRKDRLNRHMANGCHHVRLNEPGTSGAPFAEICEAFLAEQPAQRLWFEQVADLNLQPLSDLIEEIVALNGLPNPFQMSLNRARQIEAVLICGQERIKNIL